MTLIRQPFFPGKAVTVEFLNASQYFGPAAPGIEFVSNPLKYWQYPLLKTSSIDYVDFANKFVPAVGNSVVDGAKAFSATPTFPTVAVGDISQLGATTEFVETAISTKFAANPFVDLASIQTVPGFKTFQNIAVPQVPNFPNSPVSLQHYDETAVKLVGAQNISGVKTFALSPRVPEPTDAGDAVPKAVTDLLKGEVTNLLNATAALTSVVAGLTVTQGTYIEATLPCKFYWVKFGGDFKFLIVEGAGTGTDSEVIAFPTAANNFPGFINPPIVMATAVSGDVGLFTPAVSGVTNVGFTKSQDRFGGAAGQPINFIACGI